jgi:hypothetical protein
MAAYAATDPGADRKRKAIQRLRAAQMAAELLHQATQQRAGVAGSPTPGKPELPHEPPRGLGPTPGRPVVSGGQGAPGYPGAGHPPPLRGNLANDVRRVELPPQYIDEQQPQRPAGNLRTGRPYRQPQQARQPERPGLPGKPNLAAGDPLDEQLALQHAAQGAAGLGQTRTRPRARRGAQLLAQILGRFNHG